MENNKFTNKLNWLYLTGFFIILALPILTIPPYFFPADWGKSIVFRSIMAILLFLFVYQLLFRKSELTLPKFRNSKITWALGVLFIVFMLASIFSVDPYFGFWGSPSRGGGLVTFAFYFVFAIMAFIMFKKADPPAGEKAWNFSIFIGVLVSFVAIFQYYSLFSKILLASPGQPSSTMGNPILLAIYLLLLFFPTLSFAINQSFSTPSTPLRAGTQDKLKKIFYIFSLLIFLFTILISGTRAVYLGIVVGILYFLLFYPKKFKLLKISIGLFLIFIFSVVLYANIHPQLPKVLQNRVSEGLVSQLSIKHALTDERFKAWQTVSKEILDKPILGWGPENMSVGFDKNFDPKVISTPWWDKAHNIFLDIGAQAGILGILAYLSLFIVLIWQLQTHSTRLARSGQENNTRTVITGIQATLIGYLVANFFSFDDFSTYLIFFLLIGYTLHLTSINTAELENPHKSVNIRINPWVKSVIMFVLFCVLIIFLWQYNFVPFQINAQINKAEILVNNKQCDQAFNLMDKILPQHSFLDSYVRMKYVEFEKTCSDFYPENILIYTKKSIELMNEAVRTQPLYTRYWLYLGTLTTTLAEQENDTKTENGLLLRADGYLDRALQLAPKHQEILTAKAKVQIDGGNYKNAEDISEKCISLNSVLGDCYWYLGISEIYLGDNANANKNIQTAISKGYNAESEISLVELGNAYNNASDYQDLATVFEKLVMTNPNAAQYHSTLAFIYSKLGEYDKARQEANKVLQISPESKQNVNAFLKTLP